MLHPAQVLVPPVNLARFSWLATIKAQKPQPAQTVADQKLHPLVADIVLRRQNQHLEHRHGIVWRASAPGAIRIIKGDIQNRDETPQSQ